jgi:hypothetical protein
MSKRLRKPCDWTWTALTEQSPDLATSRVGDRRDEVDLRQAVLPCSTNLLPSGVGENALIAQVTTSLPM